MDEVQTIESAVLSFYRGDSEQQKETHKWLQQVQSSPQAWSFCWDLMQLNKSSEVQFFGSITLNSKLRNDWAELPKESHHELKQKLLETIVVFGNGPKIVLNRLCISLGLFIVHMLQHPTVIEEVTSMFLNEQLGNLTRVTQIEILMAVLEGIPEEVKTVRTAIPRAMVCEELNRNAEFVMQTVVTYLKEKLSRNAVEPQDMNGMINAAKCTGSWVLHGNVRLDEREAMIQTLLQAIHYCYWKEPKDDGCLMPEENELAETALKSLASIISSYATQNPKYSVTIIHFMKMFLDVLVPILDAEYKECNDNENLALMMYGLFIATLEGFASAIFDGIATESEEVASVYTRTVDMLIKCTDKPGTYPVDEMCSTYALEFWYMLQEEVLSMDTGEHRSRCHDAIRPVYAHVVKVLVRKSQLPTDSSMHKWNDDDLEAFRCYRQDIGDTLLSCHDVLGNMMLDVLSEALDESIMYLSYEQHQPTTDSWTLLEATIHAFCSIAQKVELMEHPQIVKLLKVLNEIPYEKYHDKLLGMALETVGAYSEWFGENPKYLPSAITLLVKGLSSTKASQATLGLKDLTSECHKEVVPYALPLLDACRTVLQDGQLKNPEMIRLMYTVGNILSVISYENIIIYLDAMVSPCFEELGIHVQNNDISEQAKARVVLRLEMISKLFSSLNINKTAPGADGGDDKDGQKLCLPARTSPAEPRPVQPILLILQKTMGLLKSLCTLWIHDETVIDTLCKALQQALTTLMDDMKPLLNEMCCLVLSIVNTNCVVSTADIAGNIILMFYNDQECRPLIVQLFTAIMDYNFSQMQANLDKLSRIADLIETFYAFNTRISKKIPICYSEVQIDCMQLVDYATKCMMLPEMPPMKKSVAFLTTFIKESPKHPIMGNVVLAQGENILRSTFLCIGGTALRSQVEVFAEIFLALNTRYPTEFVQWMKLLEIPNFPTAFVSAGEKEQFMRKVIKERVNKRLVQEHVRKFAAVCRNIVEYEGK
ncbi:importin-13 [Anopheles aquasalis]|uniref:importin-13 n=1 Tax=Anopheles aquasalis TaxID=42839 RepID=UPI00215A93D7|nr:importin-13 [Anopheles aquasalis]XP_050081938.1 importin-13 [Anopheles aquasalis]